jgi:hypothetical protein
MLATSTQANKVKLVRLLALLAFVVPALAGPHGAISA